MGSVHLLQVLDDHGGPGLEKVNGTHTKDYGIASVEVVGVSSEPASPTTPATTTAEILLISWLIVLLRTREDGQVSYEWAYKTESSAEVEPATTMRLSTAEILPDLESTVEQVASTIAGNVVINSSRELPSLHAGGSLLLSTGSLSQPNAKTGQDEVGNQHVFNTHINHKR